MEEFFIGLLIILCVVAIVVAILDIAQDIGRILQIEESCLALGYDGGERFEDEAVCIRRYSLKALLEEE